MLINDIFPEPVLEAIKPSDIPPSMRQRLTMKDVEAERPTGAFHYRVMFPDGTYTDFMSLEPAKQTAAREKGRIIDLTQKKI